MHAHYHTKSTLSRKVGPRRALVKGLVDSLILYEHITTTQTRAKTIVPYFDNLVTQAKKGTLASSRTIMSRTSNPVAAQKLTTELVEAFRDRQGGYTRTIKIGNRRGDNAPMVMIELILPDDFDSEAKADVVAEKAPAKSTKTSAKSATKEPVVKNTTPTKTTKKPAKTEAKS